MSPSVRSQESRDPVEVPQPNGEVEILVRPRDRASVEVDRPAAEQPVLDSVPLEQSVQLAQRSQSVPTPSSGSV
jgi:hypothetical protein